MTNKKKFISVFFALFFVFGCQKQIQLSNGRVIYQPFDGGNQIIQAQPSMDNSADINPSTPNVGNQIGNGLTQLATPAVAGATLGSELAGNNGGNGSIDMTNGNNVANTNGSPNNNGNNLTQYQQPHNVVGTTNTGTATQPQNQSLEEAINQSLGNTQNSAMSNGTTQTPTMSSNQPVLQNTQPVAKGINDTIPPIQPATKSGYGVQVGNYTNVNAANNIAKDLKAKGFDANVISDNGTNRIVVGNFATKEASSGTSEALKALGYIDAFMTIVK